MKRLIHRFSLFLFLVFSIFSCRDNNKNLSPELQRLLAPGARVPTYTSFDQISSINTIPVIVTPAFFGKETNAKVFSVSPLLEKNRNDWELFFQYNFFIQPSMQNALKLITYARQLKANHPFRINPVLPYATFRQENSFFNYQNVGPAGTPPVSVEFSGSYTGSIEYKNQGRNRKLKLFNFNTKHAPPSGLLFLFDHELFTLSELLHSPAAYMLENILVHELTHIWSMELLPEKKQNLSILKMNRTDTAHDVYMITNPYLAFSEGLAIAFEALFGTKMAQIINFSPEERERFFNNPSLRDSIKKDLSFLINRQDYVRQNAFIYNLFDIGRCSLRETNMQDTSSIPYSYNKSSPSISSYDKLNYIDNLSSRIKRGEDIKQMNFSYADFENRFFGKNLVPINFLKENCPVNPPSRLESSEGFISTVIFNLLTTEVLLDNTKIKKLNLTLQGNERKVAGFLASFEEFVKILIKGQVQTLNDLIRYTLSRCALWDRNKNQCLSYDSVVRRKVLYLFSFLSQGKFSKDFILNQSLQNKDYKGAYNRASWLSYWGKTGNAISYLGKTPELLVSYSSKLRSGNDQNGIQAVFNFNNAHHIDLIDIFGKNSQEIARVAFLLENGHTYRNVQELLKDLPSHKKRVLEIVNNMNH